MQVRGRVGAQASDVRRPPAAPHNDPFERASAAGRLQRLTVQNTQWAQTTSIKASGGGAGGVLFVKDAGDPVVVKPNVQGTEEATAAALHTKVAASQGPAQGGWNAVGLEVRLATLHDVNALRAAAAALAAPILPNAAPGAARAPKLLAALAPATTMVQAAAPQDESERGTLTDNLAAIAETPAGHVEPKAGKNKRLKSKVLANSPLKALVNEPGLARTLGRIAAVDIFLGNGDRLVGNANLDNLMLRRASKVVYPIDNVPPNRAEAALETPAAGVGPNVIAWAASPFVRLLRAGHFDQIATTVLYTSNDDDQRGQQHSITADIVQGYRNMRPAEGDQPPEPHKMHVAVAQQPLVQAKLDAAKHRKKLIANFAAGLREGRDGLLDIDHLPDRRLFSAEARLTYRTKWFVMKHGMEVAAAHNAATASVDNPYVDGNPLH